MPDATTTLPADRCDDAPGRLRPVIDRNRCEGKRDCVTACPYEVFEIGTISAEQRSALTWVGWIKALAHGGKQAFTPRADACHACGYCVEACPEKAIRLARA